MKCRRDKFAIRVEDLKSADLREYTAGKDFRLRHDSISHDLMLDLPPRLADLLRIASSVYFVDRIIKRRRNGGADGWSRRLSCSIEVVDAGFWSREPVSSLLREALEFVSGDTWSFDFVRDSRASFHRRYPLFHAGCLYDCPPVVSLYSGGLDSAAGLARRLSNGIDAPLIPVVVRHRTDIAKKATDQIGSLARSFQTELRPICAAMSMASPKQIGQSEETSQRARGFLFVSVGGAVAAATKASAVELYESGVGAINAPLLAGMEGSQATRSAHPTFLRKMSQLLSVVADHPIDVRLPFGQMTKGELVRSLESAELRDLARATISCVSYPLRHRTRKSCGPCAACLFRRVALNAAGIDELRGTYQFDVLNRQSSVPKNLSYLKAFLNQIDSLTETDAGRLPVSISKHLYQTGLVERGGSTRIYVDLYRKYRREWLAFVRKAKLNGCQWANLIDLPPKAA